jgi:flavorubredoxin
MTTRTDEITDGIYRISTFVPEVGPDGFTFNQFLVRAEEPLLFHTGPRGMFPLVSKEVSRLLPLESLRWITFGHVESDECGSMNQWLAAAPRAQVAHGEVGVMVSLNDLADRPPRALRDGEVLDLGGKRVRHIDTPHVPHGWEARVLYEETTRTLLCGDLFTHTGKCPPLVRGDVVGPARAAEEVFRASCYTPSSGPAIRALAKLRRDARAHARLLVHGRLQPSTGGSRGALRRLARRERIRERRA